MGLKRVLGRAGKFAGKAVLREVGILDPKAEMKMSEEFKEDLREVIAEGVYLALVEFHNDNPDEIEAPIPS